MPEVVTQDQLIQRIQELEALAAKVAHWKFEGDRSAYGRMSNELGSYYHLKSQIEEAQDEAISFLEP